MREGGAAELVPQQPLGDVPAVAVGDEVEAQRVPAAQAAVAQQGAQRGAGLVPQRGAALRLGEQHQEVQGSAAPSRAGRGGSEPPGGGGESLAAAAQVVEGAHGQGGRQRQGAGLRAGPARPPHGHGSPAPALPAARRHAEARPRPASRHGAGARPRGVWLLGA